MRGWMKAWARGIFYAMLCASLVVCSVACTRAVETDSVETEAQTVWEPEFASLFDARKACLNAMDYALPISCYTEESLAPYREFLAGANKSLGREGITQEEVERLYREILREKENLTLRQGDTARVCIQSNTAEPWQYSACSVVVIPAEGEEYSVVAYDDCQIRIRGNSTAGAPKKPYTFKLPEKEKLLGMDRGRRWSLLAGMFDKTLMRTQLSFHLAADLDCPYTSQTTIVEVYYNGKYQGVYDLIEPITDGKGRVDIDKEGDDFLIEIDANRNDPQYYFTTGLGLRFKVEQPEELSDARKAEIDVFFADMEAALCTGDMAQYGQYIDVDSFVNVYLVMEFTKNLDSNAFSTRFFRKDGKLYAGPVWDFDLSSGNVSDACDEEGYRIYLNILGRGDDSGDSTRGLWYREGWYGVLFDDPAFRELVRARYIEVHDILENVFRDNACGKSRIHVLEETYGDAFRRNYENTDWDITVQYSPYETTAVMTYEEHVAVLTEWFEGRLAYLDEVILGE